MVKYKCDYCNVYFDEPAITHYQESLGDFHRAYTMESCPVCGCDSFSDATHCPKCDAPMPADEHLCDACRKSLLDRFTAFADELTAEEEAQLDDWMDGDTITHRKEWR